MKNIKFINILIIIFFFTIFFIYFLYEDRFDYIIKKIYILALFCFLFLFFVYFILKNNSDKIKVGENLSRINELFIYSDKLLNEFYDFYDKSISFSTSFHNENKEEYKKNFDRLYNSSDLFDKLNELYNKVDDLIASVRNVELNFNDNLKKSDNNDADDINNNLDKIVLNFKFNSEITVELIKSIISNIVKSSNPLSEGIYKIKLTVNNFLDNISKWKDEFTNEKNEKNFNKIIVKYSEQSDEFKKIVFMINDKFSNLEKSLNVIVKMFVEINKNTLMIHEISEKIRLLSINSSIEASRAGEAGRGFKIVSEEIKKLSNETQHIVDSILPNINESKSMAARILANFEIECNEIIDKVNNQKDEFNLFYQRLSDYYNDLNSILASVSDVINQINENTNKIIPTFQMSNLTIQELENLDKIMIKFLESNKDHMELIIKSVNEEKKIEILENTLGFINKIITTKSEVELLNKIIEKFNLDKNRFVMKSDKDVELF